MKEERDGGRKKREKRIQKGDKKCIAHGSNFQTDEKLSQFKQLTFFSVLK